MRKLFTCLGIFALLTVFTAGSALALQLPTALNGTAWKWNGFEMNGTAATTNASVLITPNGYDVKSGYGRAQLNGTVFNVYYDSATGQKQFKFANGTGAANSIWAAGVAGPETIPGLLSLSSWNATGDGIATSAAYNGTSSPFYFIPSSDYGLLVGISNSTFNSTHGLFMQADYSNDIGTTDEEGGIITSGINMATLVAGTAPVAADLAGTWYFYQFGTNSSVGTDYMGIARMGSIDFTGNTATFDNNGTTVTAETITDGIANGGAYVISTGIGDYLFQNGTLDTTGNVMVGTFLNATSKTASLTVLLKSGVVGSSSDFTDIQHKFITAGTNSTGHASGLIGYYSTDDSRIITEGNATIFGEHKTNNWPAADTSFTTGETKIVYGTATVAGVSHANATFQTTADVTDQGTVIGRFNAEKTFMVGIFTSPSTKGNLRHLGFFMPSQAVVGAIGAASATYNHNATFFANLNVNGVQNATTLTNSVKTSFGLGTTYAALTDMRTTNASINNSDDDGVTVTFTFSVDGLAVSDVSSLRYVKMIVGTSSNSTMDFSYKASAATTATDGTWWLEYAANNAFVDSDASLSSSTTYNLYYTVKDATTLGFDRDTAAGSVYDPAALFSFSGSSGSSTSSSSGCVLNPAAGFGLEWLLLLAAPLLAVLRNRFRK